MTVSIAPPDVRGCSRLPYYPLHLLSQCSRPLSSSAHYSPYLIIAPIATFYTSAGDLRRRSSKRVTKPHVYIIFLPRERLLLLIISVIHCSLSFFSQHQVDGFRWISPVKVAFARSRPCLAVITSIYLRFSVLVQRQSGLASMWRVAVALFGLKLTDTSFFSSTTL